MVMENNVDDKVVFSYLIIEDRKEEVKMNVKE